MDALGFKNRMTRREFLKGLRAKNDVIPIINQEKCTGCGLCTMDCQKGALTILQNTEGGTYQFLFRHELCNVCGICEKTCPENCLTLGPILEPARRVNAAIVIFEDRITQCRGCGIPLFPLAMVNRLKSKMLAQEEADFPFDFCPSCRIKLQVGKSLHSSSKDEARRLRRGQSSRNG